MLKIQYAFRAAMAVLAFMASSTASAAQYCLMPVYELPPELAHFKTLQLKMLSFNVKKESEACNEAVYLVGTQADHNVKVEICPQSRHGCDLRTLRKPFIRGAVIGLSVTGNCHNPQFISQVNDVSYRGDKQLKECPVTVSWDPASAKNREIAYKEYYVSVGSGLAHVRAGDRNPHYHTPAPH